MDWLIYPFTFGFMQNAGLISLIIAVPAGLISCFLVLKGLSLMGDGVSHAILPGVVVAYMIGAPLLVGAFVAAMICALATGAIQGNSRVKQDTVLGVVMSGMFGLGVILHTQVRSGLHLDHILFGNMLGVGPQDLIISLVIAVAVVGVMVAKWRDYALWSFDSVQARVAGLPVQVLNYGLLTMLSLTIVSMLSAVGIILSVALLIAPGSIAFLLTRSLGRMLVVSVTVAVSCSLVGIWASFWIDSAPAATIVLVLTFVFICAFIRKQIVTRRRTEAAI